MKRRALAIAVAAGAVAAVGAAPAMAKGPFRFTVDTDRLERLSGARYEVWVVDGRRKFSAGTFNIRPNGTQTRTRFNAPVNPRRADAIAVTVEPVPDRSPAPSRAVILAGTPTGRSVALRFPVNLSGAAGSAILATPTDADPANEAAGVWFLNPAGGPGPSLTLPPLPRGWTYEGWGVTQSTPLSTGKFRSVSGPDRSAPFSGPLAGPPFPGEDFLATLPSAITPPVNLANGSSAVVVSIEPDLGRGVDPTGPGPFSIKPLVGMVGPGQAVHTPFALARDLSTVPAGTATLPRRR
jgi:hypothetical protein